jgi:uncharacterized protein (TIRG00374 family)
VRGLGRSVVLSVAAGAAVYLILVELTGKGGEVLRLLSAYPLGVILLGLGLASLNYLFRFAKWQYYLRLLGVPTWPHRASDTDRAATPHLGLLDSLLVFLAGFSLTVTPGKVGEVIRSYLLRETHRLEMARTAPIVLADRLTDLISLLLLALVGIGTWLRPDHRVYLYGGAVLCGLIVLFSSWRRLVHGILDLVLRLPPHRLWARLVPKLRDFYDAAYVLLRPGPLLLCTGLSVLAWFCECLAFYEVARGAPDGAGVSLLLGTFIYAVTTVAGALAFLPGGLGVTDGSMALLLRTTAGMSEPSAVAATLIIRAQTLWFAVLLGVIALVIYTRRRSVAVSLEALRPEAGEPAAQPKATPADPGAR